MKRPETGALENQLKSVEFVILQMNLDDEEELFEISVKFHIPTFLDTYMEQARGNMYA